MFSLFGFPASHRHMNISMVSFPLIPLQILDTPIAPAYETVSPGFHSDLIRATHYCHVETSTTVIKGNDKVLTHEWRKFSGSSTTVSKSDDSSVNTTM